MHTPPPTFTGTRKHRHTRTCACLLISCVRSCCGKEHPLNSKMWKHGTQRKPSKWFVQSFECRNLLINPQQEALCFFFHTNPVSKSDGRLGNRVCNLRLPLQAAESTGAVPVGPCLSPGPLSLRPETRPMDEFVRATVDGIRAHHFEVMRTHCLLVFTGESSFQGL